MKLFRMLARMIANGIADLGIFLLYSEYDSIADSGAKLIKISTWIMFNVVFTKQEREQFHESMERALNMLERELSDNSKNRDHFN